MNEITPVLLHFFIAHLARSHESICEENQKTLFNLIA